MTILNELLVALVGYPGDVFQKSNGYKASLEFPFVHPADRLALDRIAILGSQYELLDNFVQTNRYNGLYKSALALSVDGILEEYQRDIVELESKISNLVLGEIQLQLQQYFKIFEILVEITNDVQSLHGVEILNYISNKSKSIAVPALESVVQRYHF